MNDCSQHGWSSNDWQSHVNAILHHHFSILGHTYQRVADVMNGDGGLEGFSSNGHAYQAYADQDSNTKAERYEKQRDKITQDLLKLKKYENDWRKRLGDLQLKTWTLVVPIYEDKALISHALKKARELKAAKLTFIPNAFRAFVCDTNAFPLAVKQLTSNGAPQIRLTAEKVDQSDLEKYEQSKPKDIVIIDEKLSKVGKLKKEKNKLVELRRAYLKRYLYRENLLEILKRRHPPLKEQIDELLAAKSEDIATDSMLDTSPANKRLQEVKDFIQKELDENVRGLSSNNRSDIAYGTIGHWLINCNLRFE